MPKILKPYSQDEIHAMEEALTTAGPLGAESQDDALVPLPDARVQAHGVSSDQWDEDELYSELTFEKQRWSPCGES